MSSFMSVPICMAPQRLQVPTDARLSSSERRSVCQRVDNNHWSCTVYLSESFGFEVKIAGYYLPLRKTVWYSAKSPLLRGSVSTLGTFPFINPWEIIFSGVSKSILWCFSPKDKTITIPPRYFSMKGISREIMERVSAEINSCRSYRSSRVGFWWTSWYYRAVLSFNDRKGREKLTHHSHRGFMYQQQLHTGNLFRASSSVHQG